MKKQKLPKYVQQLFKKPQFKIGDHVKYEFLGEHGWGYITKINNYNDKITYMVKGKGYTYPCGIKIKEYSSYYAGSIDFEASKDKRNNEHSRSTKIQKRANNRTRESIAGSDGNSISNTRSRSKSTINNRNGNSKHVQSDQTSRRSIENNELEDAIDKQKDFLRKFT